MGCPPNPLIGGSWSATDAEKFFFIIESRHYHKQKSQKIKNRYANLAKNDGFQILFNWATAQTRMCGPSVIFS